ncbi:hypothetical protein ACJZ2D_003579 [Fusarium nematophilum]
MPTGPAAPRLYNAQSPRSMISCCSLPALFARGTTPPIASSTKLLAAMDEPILSYGHIDLRYGAKDVAGSCDDATVYGNPRQLMDEFLAALASITAKVQSYARAGRSSSPVIIVCGPTSLPQDIISALPCPVDRKHRLAFTHAPDEPILPQARIRCGFHLSPSMLCNGWVVNQSLCFGQSHEDMGKIRALEMAIETIRAYFVEELLEVPAVARAAFDLIES